MDELKIIEHTIDKLKTNSVIDCMNILVIARCHWKEPEEKEFRALRGPRLVLGANHMEIQAGYNMEPGRYGHVMKFQAEISTKPYFMFKIHCRDSQFMDSVHLPGKWSQAKDFRSGIHNKKPSAICGLFTI